MKYFPTLLIALATVLPSEAKQADLSQFDYLMAVLTPADREEAWLRAPIEGSPELRTIREGSGRFVCIGDVPGNERYSASCFHRSLLPFIELERRLAAEGLSGADFRATKCELINSGEVPVPERALLLSASGQRSPGGGLPQSVTLYRLLQMPGATAEETGLPEEELAPGAPYLHNGGTCDAHVMWSTTETALAR